MRAARNTISLFALLALSSCASPQAGPPTVRMPRPNMVQPPTGEAAPELVTALSDLDPVWVTRARLARLTDGMPITCRVRRDGSTGPATDENSDFLVLILGNRSGSQGADSDRDGLSDEAELAIGTDPDAADTDGDTIPDGFEAFGTRTRPELADSDGDGTRDDAELDLDDPMTYSDTDGDGLFNGQERASFASDPSSVDSDDDGFGDDYEFLFWTAMNDAEDPDLDADDDGQPDDFEMANGFDPQDADSHEPDADGDALPDFVDSYDEDVYAWVPGRSRGVAAGGYTGPVTPGDVL
jgi:hypothetical protein